MGGGNLGDDATQDAVIQNIKNRWPNAEIFLFSMNPADSCPRHGIPSYPIRTETWVRSGQQLDGSLTVQTRVKNVIRKYPPLFQFLKIIYTLTIRVVPSALFDELSFLVKSFLIIRSFDLLIISGGGQLLDAWGGPWKFPYTVFKWTLLAKLSGANCYFLNVGAGPLNHSLSKWFVKHSLRLADYVSFRDEDSRSLIQKIGYAGESKVSADCVYALDRPAPHAPNVAEEALVGLSPMAYCDPRIYWQKDQAIYNGFVSNFASFGGWLGKNHYRLAIFSTDIFFDSQTIEEVRTALERSNGDLLGHLVKRERITEVIELLFQMNSMDYIVTCRFHGVVFAHLLNKPVLAISHHPKVSTLMSDLGLARYCVDIRKCDANILQETFLSLVANQKEIRCCLADKAACYRRALSAQFDQLFPQGAKT